MAYVDQELKGKIAPAVKALCQKYGVKATLAVRHHSTLVLNVKSGNIDFIGNYSQIAGTESRPSLNVNPYHFENHFSGRALEFLKEVIEVMRGPDYFDDSDIQSDYFHCSHYIDVNVGRWDQPYILNR
jgi:hypothetical protein